MDSTRTRPYVPTHRNERWCSGRRLVYSFIYSLIEKVKADLEDTGWGNEESLLLVPDIDDPRLVCVDIDDSWWQ